MLCWIIEKQSSFLNWIESTTAIQISLSSHLKILYIMELEERIFQHPFWIGSLKFICKIWRMIITYQYLKVDLDWALFFLILNHCFDLCKVWTAWLIVRESIWEIWWDFAHLTQNMVSKLMMRFQHQILLWFLLWQTSWDECQAKRTKSKLFSYTIQSSKLLMRISMPYLWIFQISMQPLRLMKARKSYILKIWIIMVQLCN